MFGVCHDTALNCTDTTVSCRFINAHLHVRRWVIAGAGNRLAYISEGNDLGHERCMTYHQVLAETCRVVSDAVSCRLPAAVCALPPSAGRDLQGAEQSAPAASCLLPHACQSLQDKPRGASLTQQLALPYPPRPTGCVARA